MKKLIVLLLTVFYSISSYSQCAVYGKIRLVDYGEDVKVRVINELDYKVNLKVKIVSDFADEAGKWQFVDFGEDFKVRVVEYDEDFTVQMVSYDWGCGKSSRYSGAYTNPKYIENNTAQTILDAIEKEEQKATERSISSKQAPKFNSQREVDEYNEKVRKHNKAVLNIIGLLLGITLLLGLQA